MSPRFDPALLPDRPDLHFEAELWAQGCRLVAGVDEAGRGALAGPVAAAALVFPPDPELVETCCGVRDSKQMTPAGREHWAARLAELAAAWAVGYASAQEIDALGIAPATRLAIRRALDGLAGAPQHLLVDYLRLPEIALPQTPLVKGDARSLSIAAASVMAKTGRDAWMTRLEQEHPGYGFAAHKGYGTLGHRRAIAQLGVCAEHRLSFNFGLEGI